jgi:hypothetical protein
MLNMWFERKDVEMCHLILRLATAIIAYRTQEILRLQARAQRLDDILDIIN